MTDIDTYSKALADIESYFPAFHSVGHKAYHPGEKDTARLSALLGAPHEGLRCIHVAGTNGKGTTAHLIAAALQAQGFRTGLYTSPHIGDLRERILTDGCKIGKDEVTDFMRRYHDAVDGSGLQPSFFELLTVMAFDCFRRRDTDYAVVEVGLGGRLDATNIITPELCVITNISLDHTDILGDTPEKIAAEKAGIIKRGVPVVIGEAEGAVRDVFVRRSAELGAPISFACDRADIVAVCSGEDAAVDVEASPYGAFATSLHGSYQTANARTAICALERLGATGDDAVREGFMRCADTLRGRWQTVDGVLCDTGHNPAAWRHTSRYLTSRSGRLTAIIGFCADKDVDTVVGMLPEGVEYFCVAAPTGRAMAADDLCARLRSRGLDATPYPGVAAAIDAARRGGREIFLGGSFFVVAEYLKNQ